MKAAYRWAACLPARNPKATSAPVFLALARQDPGTDRRTRVRRFSAFSSSRGGSMARGRDGRRRVIDLTPDADNGASVDPATCEPRGDGHASLCHRWVDEDFDPAERAYYYVRSPRESERADGAPLQCLQNGYDCEQPHHDARCGLLRPRARPRPAAPANDPANLGSDAEFRCSPASDRDPRFRSARGPRRFGTRRNPSARGVLGFGHV